MPTQETLLTVLLIALAANFVLIVLVIITAWLRGRRRASDDSAPITLSPSAIEHRLPEMPTAPAVAEPAPAVAEPAPAVAARRGDMAAAEGAHAHASRDTYIEPEPDVDHGPRPGVLVDPGTGLDTPRLWGRTLADEMARIARYRRPASIILVEVEGIERLVERFGDDAAARLLPMISETLRKSARAADHVAILDSGRYGVLLTETDEVRAINYIERVRTACDGWLAAGAVTLRLDIGWADANAGRSIDDALLTAQERLDADRRRPPATPDLGPSMEPGAFEA